MKRNGRKKEKEKERKREIKEDNEKKGVFGMWKSERKWRKRGSTRGCDGTSREKMKRKPTLTLKENPFYMGPLQILKMKWGRLKNVY